MLHDKSPAQRKTEQVLIRWVAYLVAGLVRILPLRWLHALGNAVGTMLYRGLGTRRRLALANMRLTLGDTYTDRELSGLLLASVRNMTKTMLELLKIPYLSDPQFSRFATVHGAEHLQEAVARGSGVIVVTPHFGSWEGLAASICRMGYPITVIARDANDPPTALLIRRAREAVGEHIIEREELREMLRALTHGGILGILPDQHTQGACMWLDFMGRLAATATGPATLAIRTGAAIVPGFARRLRDDRLSIEFLPAIVPPESATSADRTRDICRLTQHINDVLGDEICRHPEQWLWMHNRWRTPPDNVDAAPDLAASDRTSPR